MIAATLADTLTAVGGISSGVYLTLTCVQVVLCGPRLWWRYGLGMGVRIRELVDDVQELEELEADDG